MSLDRSSAQISVSPMAFAEYQRLDSDTQNTARSERMPGTLLATFLKKILFEDMSPILVVWDTQRNRYCHIQLRPVVPVVAEFPLEKVNDPFLDGKVSIRMGVMFEVCSVFIFRKT